MKPRRIRFGPAFTSLVLFAAAVFVLAILAFPRPASTCEFCKSTWLTPQNSWCRPVDEGQTGRESCEATVDLFGISCQAWGAFCEGITVIGDGGGGGGGGTGGGGSNPCDQTGFCPAECFSCGGGNAY